jgi:HemY protein
MRVLDVITVLAAGGVTGVLLERSRRAVGRRTPLVATRALALVVGGAALPAAARLAALGADERAVLALALADATPGLGVEWLPRLEAAAQAYAREPAMGFAVGMALAERQLWGKARRLLEDAAADTTLRASARRKAWLTLARIAAEEGDSERAARAYESAAILA